MQEHVDKAIAQIDQIIGKKESEIMEI
jgi:ribosome recycling factor